MIIDNFCNGNFESFGRACIYSEETEKKDKKLSELSEKLKEKYKKSDLIDEVEEAIYAFAGAAEEDYYKYGMATGIRLILEANEIWSEIDKKSSLK